jgi:hypothetical protein
VGKKMNITVKIPYHDLSDNELRVLQEEVNEEVEKRFIEGYVSRFNGILPATTAEINLYRHSNQFLALQSYRDRSKNRVSLKEARMVLEYEVSNPEKKDSL